MLVWSQLTPDDTRRIQTGIGQDQKRQIRVYSHPREHRRATVTNTCGRGELWETLGTWATDDASKWVGIPASER